MDYSHRHTTATAAADESPEDADDDEQEPTGRTESGSATNAASMFRTTERSHNYKVIFMSSVPTKVGFIILSVPETLGFYLRVLEPHKE